MISKGIILCGGTGSRLFPVTKSINKHLLPVYNKPMFFYSLSVLMLAGIRNILIITGKNQKKNFENTIGNYSDLGIKLNFSEQSVADGIPDAILAGKDFIKKDNFALILGDNFFYGSDLSSTLLTSFKKNKGGTIFLYPSKNPNNYGVVELDKNKKIEKIVEKPKKTKSNLIITGLYLLNHKVFEYAKNLKKSKRNETEIVDLIKIYNKNKKLKIINLQRGSAWLDMGTFNDLIRASSFVENIEKRQSYQIACLEEIAFSKGWINKKNILHRIKEFKKSSYSEYLKNII
jgi:glucose-1-phosphate thymidylyltransferase